MTEIKIFIASSAELKEEREKCILLITQLNSAHKHLVLKPVEWEISMVHSSYPGYKDIQDAINPMLKESQLAIFIFYSRIGQYTLQEFEYANKEGKKLMVFFRTGFSPSKQSIKQYQELLDFQDSLNSTVLYKEYKDLNEFEKQLFANLNLELANTYPITTVTAGNETAGNLSQSNLELIRMLGEKDKEIAHLNETLTHEPDAGTRLQLEQLEKEKAAVSQELLQSQEIIEQQAKDKEDLQQQLMTYKGDDALKAKALEEVEKGNYPEAETYLKESAKKSIEQTASTFYELAKIKKLQLDYAEAFRFYELAAKIDPENSFYLNEAGILADDLGYYDKAIAYFERSLSLIINTHGDECPEASVRYNNLGTVYNSRGEYDKAISFYEKALMIDEKFLSDDGPDIAIRYNNLGSAYDGKKEYDKAISYYSKALSNYKKSYGEEHADIALEYNNLGAVYHAQGDYDKAISFYELALSIEMKIFGDQYPDIATRYNNLGEAYRSKREFDKAIDYLEKALSIDKKVLGEEHPNIATRYNNLGLVYYNKGEFEKAIQYYDQTLPILQKFLPPDHPNTLTSKKNLALAQKALAIRQAGSRK